MSLLDDLYALNGMNQPAPKPVKVEDKPGVTFVLTSCGRLDLLEQTLDSFLANNTYPIERYIIAEDSADPVIFQQCEMLNQTKYAGILEFMFNEKKLGQAKSIDAAYRTVTTPYVFHCEDDWQFYRSGFIQQSIKVLEADPTILQAWIRPKSDGILNDISPEIENLGAFRVRKVLPKSFKVKGAGERGGDLIVNNYMGFSWNPGLKRMSDYNLLRKGYSGFVHEHMIDAFYRGHEKGFRVVSLSLKDDEGYVKHIGWNRRVPSPVHGSDKRTEVYEKKDEAPKVQLPSISVVMQAYLGDYPGSRSNSVEKFHRAVNSFLSQEYKRAELVIVSDGCGIVHSEMLRYANNPSIKYVYVDKAGAGNMYESSDGQKFFRGQARKAGVEAAIGDLVTYMDSDDVLTSKFLYNIVYSYNLAQTADWWLNTTWYDHRVISTIPLEKIGVIDEYDGNIFRFEGLDSEFVQTRIKNGLIVNTPWLLTHRRSCNVQWQDTIGVSEDVDFGRRLRAQYPKGSLYAKPGYIRCHYSGLWDA